MIVMTATELARFMACNGSRLLPGVPAFEKDDTQRLEGDAVHWFVEQVWRGHSSAEELVGSKAPNGVRITEEMATYSERYLNDIRGKGYIEVDTSHGTANYQINGRADHAMVELNTLIVSDFKYGWKIVEPKMNWTLISHAVAFLGAYGHTFSEAITKVAFRIYQPRPFHAEGQVREWVIDYHEFMKLVRELDGVLSQPSDECKTSSHCYRCPSLSLCKSAQIATMNSIDVAYKAFDSKLDNQSLQFMLDEIARASEMLEQSQKAYIDVALHKLKVGEVIPNYTAQKTYANAKWKEETTPDLLQILTGADYSKKELLSPAQAKKKGLSEEVIKALTERPQTGFKLARIDGSKKAEKLLS
jgi:hypothetical protein